MRYRLYRILCAALYCCAPLWASAQTAAGETSAAALYHEGEMLFRQQAYAASVLPLQNYLRRTEQPASPADADRRREAEYMLVCTAYELRQPQALSQLQAYLKRYPDTSHAHRLRAMMASLHFFAGDYDEALEAFAQADLALLADAERDDMTYRLASCHLQTGNVHEAAVWFETLRSTSPRYAADCTYYLSYIRYTQGRYDEALPGFLALQEESKYRALVPYYTAEIYLQTGQSDKAEAVAQRYLSAYAGEAHEAEMHRVLGTVAYRRADYQAALRSFERYQTGSEEPLRRRDALYMQGLSAFHCGAYSQVPELLGEVVADADDALTQNACLHMGLAYLQMADKTKARLAFGQASASDADLRVKEQAAYNHALCIHETAYSAFGESVTVFEKFLNDFPASAYADRVGGYLVEVYMNTRSYEAALQSINRIARPGRPILEAKQKILFQLGTQHFANTQFAQAADCFTQSIALGDYNRQTKAEALYWLGEAEYCMGHRAEAARRFNAYLSTTSQRNTEMYPLAHYNLGYIAFDGEEYATAEQRFSDFLRLQRGTDAALVADAYNRLGDCALHGRRFDEARERYARAEAQGTSSADYSYYQQALVAGLQKDYAAKIALLDKLAERYPASPYAVNALYEKGRSYVQTGDNSRAIVAFDRLVKNHPESPVSRKAAAEIGLLYYQAGDYDRAIAAYKQVITRYPGSEEARLAMRDLKNVYVDANRVEEFAAFAAATPNVRFEASEQDSLTYVAAEKVLMKGENVPARNSFARYLQSYPDGAFSLEAHYNLLLLAREQGDEEAVLTHTGHLLEYPDSPYTEEALLMRGEILFNRKQYAEALADYKALQARAATAERRRLGATGVLRCAALLKDDAETIHAATALLAEDKLSPELQQEALYFRAKAYLNQQATEKAAADLALLAEDTRTLYGAEAKYLLAKQHYDAGRLETAEQELLAFIDQSTPHAYWLARSFVLLSDVYAAMGKKLDARQYLLSLQQNYQADDDIASLIEERLERLK